VSVLVANAVEWPSPGVADIEALAISLAANTVGTAALIDAALAHMRAAVWGRIAILSTDILEQPMAGSLGGREFVR
jgi:2-hydroxycyclohexanecarboxyl-CoA dehydrogenase